MEKVKEAFQKIKEDMGFLWQEISLLSFQIKELHQEIDKIFLFLDYQKQKELPTQEQEKSTLTKEFPTDFNLQEGLKVQNRGFSIGNEGVPTDKQTNQQTNRQTNNDSFKDANEILDSLDHIKKEIRLKFKRLTEQEILIFSTIYQLEEQGEVDYKVLSQKLSLSESSIRDYVGKLIKKGIPVEKIKLNNKKVKLFISPSLKKIASLQTILNLKEL